MRNDISKAAKKRILNLLSKEEEVIRKANREKILKLVYKSLNTQFLVHRFVVGFRRRKMERDKLLKLKEIENEEKNILDIDQIEKLVNPKFLKFFEGS